MNSRERIFAALERRVPDRVPVMEMAIDWKVVKGLGCRSYFDAIETLDMDGVSTNQVAYTASLIGRLARIKGQYTDQWGVTKRITHEVLPFPVSHPIKTRDDLEGFRPPNPAKDVALKAIRAVVRRYKGKRAIVYIARGVFVDSWSLCGMENLLSSFALDPDFAKDLAELTGNYNRELHCLAIAAGVDVIVLADDYAHKHGTLMSPAHFREFILPGLTKTVENIKKHGAYCVKHTDGNIWDIIEDLVGTGIDGIGPLEPGAGMDLAEVKKDFGDRVCVIGNVDVDLLCRGSVEEVKEAAQNLIEGVSPGGGHILSSGNSVTSPVKADNFRAMVDAAHATGLP